MKFKRKPVFAAAAALLFVVSLALPIASAQSGGPGSNIRGEAVLREMQQVEDSWDAAITKRDQYALENVLSPQVVDVAATGDVSTRDQDVAKLFIKDALPAWLKQTVLNVRTIGDNAKVVNGTYVMHWTAGSGAPSGTPASVDEKGIFTQVFQLVNGRWICVNSQRTVVAEQAPTVKTKAATPRAKSNAAEPFHIPLIYKGAQPAASTPATPPQ